MTATADDVLTMLAKERGLPLNKIEPSSRLLQDLGMDGDDAVDFFISLQERFGTDLTSLQESWSEHFGPEGFSLWNGLVIIPVALAAGLAAGYLEIGALGGILIAIGLLATWLWVMRRFGPPDKMRPVTVAQVIEAVEAGSWPQQA